MKLRRLLMLTLPLVAGVGLCSQANAAWTFNGNGDAYTHYNAGSNSASLDISGVYASNGGTYTNSSNYNIDGFASGANWSAGTLEYYSGGLGMSSDGSTTPNHAIDNGPRRNSSNVVTGLGNTEGVLLNFSSSVVLSSIGLGYISGDADISVFRYNGPSAPSGLAGVGASLGSMASAGWELVGNYGGLTQDTTNPYNLVNTGNVGSSWWLISAYNTSYGTTSANGNALGQGNDYFKVYAVAGSACTNGNCGTTTSHGVPEPTSLALVAAALLGAAGARLRRS